MLKLKFVKNVLKFIDKDAFNQKPLLNITELVFKHITIISVEFKTGALNGLLYLKHLTFDTITDMSMNYNFLESVASQLEQIRLFRLETANLYNIIGSLTMHLVNLLALTQSMRYRVITQNTITNMPNITHLQISSCNIEAIANGAFDRIGTKLRVLDLTRNNLKTLPADLFDNLNALSLDEGVFSGNPLECTCDIKKLSSTYPTTFRYACETQTETQAEPNCMATVPSLPKDATEAQQCFNHFGTNTIRITYPIVFRKQFNVTDRKLIIRGSIRSLFRLLVLRDGSQQSTYCVRTMAKYAAISMNRIYLDIGTYTICIMDNLSGLVWPLNCISLNVLPSNGWIFVNDRLIILVGFFVLFLLNILGSIILGGLLVLFKLGLLGNISYVALQRNLHTNKVEKAFIVPKDWTKFQKLRWLKSMKYAERTKENRRRSTDFKLSIMAGGVVIEENCSMQS